MNMEISESSIARKEIKKYSKCVKRHEKQKEKRKKSRDKIQCSEEKKKSHPTPLVLLEINSSLGAQRLTERKRKEKVASIN